MIVIGDGGDIVATAAKIVPVPQEGTWMDPGPLGTLGVGMPFALAAQLALPEKRVLIIYGDGSFGLNGFEYDTAVRHNLPIVGIIGNDAAWGQMLRPQVAIFGGIACSATLLELHALRQGRRGARRLRRVWSSSPTTSAPRSSARRARQAGAAST